MSQIDEDAIPESAVVPEKPSDDLFGPETSDSDVGGRSSRAVDSDSDSDNESVEISERAKKPKKRKFEGTEKSKKSKKLSKDANRKVKKLFDTEAAESGSDKDSNESGSESGSSASEEVDENADYEYDGFVVRDGEESDSDAELFERSDKKKKKRELKRIQKKKISRLDDDDYQLIRDNLEGVAGNRSLLRTAADGDHSDGEGEGAEGGNDDEVGDDVGGSTLPLKAGSGGAAAGYDDYDDGSDMDGFLVDESDDENGPERDPNAAPVRPVVRRPRGVRVGPTVDQLKDATEIFGVGYDDFDDDKELEDKEYSDEDEDLPEEEKQRLMTEKLRTKYDRAVLVENFCTEQDDNYRQLDVPERLQDELKDRNIPSDSDIEEESLWMAGKLLDWMIIINPNESYSREDLSPKIQETCKFVLQFYLLEHMEIPFIWAYRKDYLHDTIQSKHLWKIVELDELWMRLFEGRRRLYTVLQAVNDAASSTKAANDAWVKEHRVRVQSVRALQVSIRRLQSEVEAAEEDHETALNVVDQRDDEATPHERELVEITAQAVQNLQQQLESETDSLQRQLDQLAADKQRRQLCARYKPEAAAEVVRLFPSNRYEYMLLNARDEQDLRDLSGFLSLLLKGSEAGTSSASKSSASTTLSSSVESSQEDTAGDSQAERMMVDDDTNSTSRDRVGENDGDESVPRDDDPMDVIDDDVIASAVASATTATRHKIGAGKDDYLKYKRFPRLRELVELISVPAADFGDSFRLGVRVEPPPIPELLPNDLAEAYVVPDGLRSPDAVLRAVRVLTATEISHEPSVKSYVRNCFRNGATISTRPTPAGITAINPFSELFGIHYLDEKPIRDFLAGSPSDRVLFLRLREAEKRGLITITINPPLKWSEQSTKSGNRIPDYGVYFEIYRKFMSSKPIQEESNIPCREAWDSFRMQLIHYCLEQCIVPTLKSELDRELMISAKDAVLEQIGDSFSRKLSFGPVETETEDREITRKKLVACPNRPVNLSVACIYQEAGDARASVSMAFVDKEGVLREHSVLPGKAGMEKLKEKLGVFLYDNQPELIVLNASAGRTSRNTKMTLLKAVIPEVIAKLDAARDEKYYQLNREYDPDDDEDKPYSPTVAILDDELAGLFKKSTRAKKMFPDLEAGTSAAVCLARYAQEPLAEYCALWTSVDAVECFGYESMFLNLHPLKSLIRGGKKVIIRQLERCLMDAVCAVGVNINRAVSYDHYAPMLAFVAGLGLRKADALRREIKSTVKVVESRDVLLSKKLVGAIVYTNAVGFIRVEGNPDGDSNPLDDSRIHPECYNTHKFAIQLCADAQGKLLTSLPDKRWIEVVEAQFKNSRNQLMKKIRDEDGGEWLDAWASGVPTKTYEFHKVRQVKEADNRVTSVQEKRVLTHELRDELDVLDIEDYAEKLLGLNLGRRCKQLENVKSEIRFPWLDMRKPIKEITDNELFSIISGESDNSLYVGLKVGCTIMEINDLVDPATDRRRQKAFVATDSGLRGFLSAFEVTDDRIDPQRFDMNEKIKVGQHIQAVVVGVNKVHQSVDLSIKPSLLAVGEDWWMERRFMEPAAVRWWTNLGRDPSKAFDVCFLEREALQEYKQAEDAIHASTTETVFVADRFSSSNVEFDDEPRVSRGNTSNGQKPKGPVSRAIQHPMYRNCDYKGAEEYLRTNGTVGDMVLRPSSKGPNMLAITWVFYDDIFRHIDVEEFGRRPGSAQLGSELKIADCEDTFSDIDQIYQLYITPMNDFVSSMTTHKCFRNGTVQEVEEYLFKQREANPMNIPYCVRLEPSKPGYFTLTWLSRNSESKNVKKELIGVTPSGFRMQKKIFPRPSELIAWFKGEVVKVMTAQSARSRAAQVAPPIPPTFRGGPSVNQSQSQTYGHQNQPGWRPAPHMPPQPYQPPPPDRDAYGGYRR